MRISTECIIYSAIMIFVGAAIIGIWRDFSLFVNEYTARLIKNKSAFFVTTAITDILFAVFNTAYLTVVLYYCNEGVFRIIYPIIFILAHLIYRITMRRIVLKLLSATEKAIDKFVSAVTKAIIKSIRSCKKSVVNNSK